MLESNPFDGLAERYQANRPDYPAELLQALRQSADHLPVKQLVDVGSGTGIATRALRSVFGHDWRLIGLEPGADMRSQAKLATPADSNIEYIDGAAESLPFADHSCGVVTVAQAIQFFDRPIFYADCSRVLCAGGALAVLQNNRDWRASPLLDAYESYTEQHSADYSRDYREIDIMGEFNALDWAAACARHDYKWTLPVTPDRFVGITLSRRTMKPVVAKLGETAVEEFLRELAMRHAGANGLVDIRYISELFVATKDVT